MGGQNSKTAFVEIIGKLRTEDVDPNEHEFWDELWKTALNIEDIFEIISANDVRTLIKSKPNNIKTLFTQAVAQLYQVVETPYPVYFDQALNCARILCRVLPLMIENTSAKYIKELMWGRRTELKSPLNSEEESKTEVNQEEDLQESEPLAVILVNTIFHLLFLPDFTIEDPDVDFNESDINTKEFKAALMWAPGVGSLEKTIAGSTQFDRNRIDVLRLLIVSFCDSLYQNADSYDSCRSYWLEVATSVDSPYAEIVCFSLLNTVLGYDPVGWGVPYSNLVSTDTAKLVMEASVQALVILLDYGHPISPPTGRSSQSQASTSSSSLHPSGSIGTMASSSNDSVASGNQPVPVQQKTTLPSVQPNDTEAKGFNVFRRILSEISAPDQLLFIYKGFVRLLNNVHQADSAYLPYSITRIGIEQELLVLLWKCLEEIPLFMNYILRNCDVTEILVPVCYFLLEGRKDPSKVGLIYLCTFTLLKLSGERDFGVSLNTPYQLTLPVDVPLFSGNHNDLLIIVLHRLIVSGVDKLSALYNCFLTIICNVSPYCKTLGTVASVKLVNLFQLFASPKFLYASEGNYVYLSMMLETFNNIIQYQYEGNGNLIYSIIRRKETFEGLSGLTLQGALAKVNSTSTTATSGASGRDTLLQEGKGGGKKKGKHDDQTVEKKELSGVSDESSLHGAAPESYSNVVATDLISTSPVEERPVGTEEGSSSRIESSSSSRSSGGRFVPDERWIEMIKVELPLQTVLRLMKHLVPKVEDLISERQVDEHTVIEFLKRTTMVGLLPVPHPIVIRKYQPNKYTCLWFTAFQWGVIFMHNQSPPLFDGGQIKLFMVQQTATM